MFRLCGSFNDRLGHILDDACYFIKFATRNNEISESRKSGFHTPQTIVSFSNDIGKAWIDETFTTLAMMNIRIVVGLEI